LTTERIEPNFSGDGFSDDGNSDDGNLVVTYTAVSSPAPQSTNTAGLVDEKRRSGVARFFLYGAALSILAGFGILASSLGVATFLPTSEPAIELTSGDPGPQTVPTGVRQIPLPASVAIPSGVVLPPIPRPRPPTNTANLEPVLDAAHVSAPNPASASNPGLAEPVISPTPALAATTDEIQTPPGSSDGLISGIEDALARIDAATLLRPSDLAENARPSVLPPPAAGAYPNGDYPSAGYSTGPIPPEAIPYVHPQGDIEQSEVGRPGIMRRTIDKTTGTLARVLRPNQD